MNFLRAIYKVVHNIVTWFLCVLKFNEQCTDITTNLPTLKKIPLLGHTYLFLPGGKYSFERLTEAVLDISKLLGKRFILNLGGIDMFITLEPNDAKTLFKAEGKYPIRPPFEALIHYRKKAFNSVGCVPGNGKEWQHYRKGMEPLLKMIVFQKYKDKQRCVANQFVDFIASNQDKNGILHNMFDHLMKYTIQAISVVSPGKEIDCLTESNKSHEIIEASNNFMEGLYTTIGGLPFWKIYETSGYKKIKSAHECIYRLMCQHLLEINNQFKEDPETVLDENPFMFYLLKNDEYSWEDKIILAMEIFFGGIDASATTIAFTLHFLGLNNLIQQKARKEIESNNETYIKACIKETLRLCPTAGATGRFLPQDTTFENYTIPKETLVLTFNSAASLLDDNFEEALVYRPERWLDDLEKINPNVSLPFGHGARMCPGRKLAVQEIVVLLQEILKNYTFETVNKNNIGMIFRMNRIPDRPISIKFSKIN